MAGVLSEGWTDFFVAMAGAGAALAGLIIVAMSVTIRQILDSTALPSRAAATIASLVLVVVASGLCLIPSQAALALGLELVAVSLTSAAFAVVSFVRIVGERPRRPPAENAGKIVVGAAQPVLFLVGAVLVTTGDAAGLGWLAAGILITVAFSMANAWVLLVEVQR